MKKIILFLLTLLSPVAFALDFPGFVIPDLTGFVPDRPGQNPIQNPVQTPAGPGNQLFGYYKIGIDNGVRKMQDMQDHVNVVHITTADPFTVSLEHFKQAKLTNTKLIIEFNPFYLDYHGQNGCNYNKCFRYDDVRFQAIINTVIETIIKPFNNEVIAIYILDEPETNPPTNASLNRAIQEIRKHREFDNKAILVNYDNVWKQYTGVDFELAEGVNWVSVTPSFGRYCNGLCETGKYRILLDAIEQRNSQRTDKIKLLIIGDAWSQSPDKDRYGNLTSTGNNHLQKINTLYDTASSMAGERNIPVVGMLTFAYDWFDNGAYALANSTQEIKDAWKAKAKAITGIGSASPTPTPTPAPPANEPVKQFLSVQASSVLWSAQHLIDARLNTVYSSQFNPKNPWFAAWLPSRKTVSKLELYARTKDGKPLGFPKQYRIQITSEDNSRWIPVSSSAYTIQPTDGKVTINFGRSYNTYGVLLSAEKLGLDDHNNPYLQLREIQFK